MTRPMNPAVKKAMLDAIKGVPSGLVVNLSQPMHVVAGQNLSIKIDGDLATTLNGVGLYTGIVVSVDVGMRQVIYADGKRQTLEADPPPRLSGIDPSKVWIDDYDREMKSLLDGKDDHRFFVDSPVDLDKPETTVEEAW